MHRLTPQQIAEELDIEARALKVPSTEAIRRVRRRGTRDLRERSGEDVIAVALSLVGRHRWMAYELVYHHRAARSLLDAATVETLGEGFAGWGDVDSFARYISGPTWQQRLLDDDLIARWARSPDRWWRRAALVSTVPLNLRSAGGTGDTTGRSRSAGCSSRTATTWWSRPCRGRYGSLSSGILTPCGHS